MILVQNENRLISEDNPCPSIGEVRLVLGGSQDTLAGGMFFEVL